MDCTFLTEQGKFNLRAAVIIRDGRKLLMARNPNETREFYYSVGGRVFFGETLEEAATRELREETGVNAEIERLAAVHENFFTDDNGVPFHEISVFFTVKPHPELRKIPNGRLTDQGPKGEFLEWIDLDRDKDKTIYPNFFRTMDFQNAKEVRHFITRDNK